MQAPISISRRGILLGVVGIGLLLTVWLGRARAVYPESRDGELFSVRDDPDMICKVDIEVHDLLSREGMLVDDADDDFTDEFDRTFRRHAGSPVGYSAGPPMVVPRSSRDRDTEEGGLFGSDSLSPFASGGDGTEASGWGWLADEVNTARRNEIDALSEQQSQRGYSRRLEGESGDLGVRYRQRGDEDMFFRMRESRF